MAIALLLVGYVLFFQGMALAVSDDELPVRVTQLTTRDGLPSNQVLYAAEDPYGQVWISTQNGLCYYDGHRVHPAKQEWGLPAGSKSITFDESGHLWGSTPRGFFRFDGAEVRHFHLPDTIKPTVLVHPVLQHFRGNMVYTMHAGWVSDGDSFFEMSHLNPNAPSLQGKYYHYNPVTGHHFVFEPELTGIQVYDSVWQPINFEIAPASVKPISWQLLVAGMYREFKGTYYRAAPVRSNEFPLLMIDPETEKVSIIAECDEHGIPYAVHENSPDILLVHFHDKNKVILFYKDGERYMPLWDKVPGSIRKMLVSESNDIYLLSDKGVHILHLPPRVQDLIFNGGASPRSPLVLVTEADGRSIPFAAQRSPKVRLTGDRLSFQAHIAGHGVELDAMEYRVNRGPWRTFPASRSRTVEGLHHGTNRITLRPKAPGGQSDSEANPVVMTAEVELPFFSRLGVRMAGFFLFIGMLGAMVWSAFTRQKIRRRLAALQQQLHYMRLKTIQSQLNPHFLFNAMISLQNSILNKSSREASMQLIKLAKMIRELLEMSQGPQEGPGQNLVLVPLHREIKLIEDYIDLENRQRDPQFKFRMEVDPDLEKEDPLVPPLMVQPFVENAIIHGISSVDRGEVTVRITREGDVITYHVEDNGIGREASREKTRKGIMPFKSRGGEILRQRIELLRALGLKTDLNVSDRLGGGTFVQIKIPTTP